MNRKKVSKTLDFLLIDTWNNIDQLQRSGSCIIMSKGCIWVGRIWTQILLEGHKYIYICMYVCMYVLDNFLTFIRIKTRVPSHQELLKIHNKKIPSRPDNPANTHLPEEASPPRTCILPRDSSPQDQFLLTNQGNRDRRPPSYPSTSMESDVLPGHFMFQTLRQLLLQCRQL